MWGLLKIVLERKHTLSAIWLESYSMLIWVKLMKMIETIMEKKDWT